MHRKPLLWVAALALAAVLGLSAQASASTVKGTVVHANKRAHTFVVAGRHGRLTVVSSRRVARAGSVVSVSVRRTRAGLLRARHMHVRGHRRHARIRGIVTWENAKGFTVASSSASLLVHKSSSDDGAPVGTPVQSNVTIDDQGDLEDDDTQQVGQVPAQIKLEGVVLSTDPTAETITISGDDDQEDAGASMSDDGGDQGNTQPAIVIHVPDATKFMVGDQVELIVTGPASDGSFTLVSVDEQEGQNQGDDNQGQTPGADDSSGSGDSSGGDSGSSGSDG
jgi:hypothetical protein